MFEVETKVKTAESSRKFGEHQFPTLFLDGVLLTSGKWYFEVTIGLSLCAQLGFVDLTFIASNENGKGACECICIMCVYYFLKLLL